jgi:hypothetical protein
LHDFIHIAPSSLAKNIKSRTWDAYRTFAFTGLHFNSKFGGRVLPFESSSLCILLTTNIYIGKITSIRHSHALNKYSYI